MIVNSGHSRVTDRKAVINYCVTVVVECVVMSVWLITHFLRMSMFTRGQVYSEVVVVVMHEVMVCVVDRVMVCVMFLYVVMIMLYMYHGDLLIQVAPEMLIGKRGLKISQK